MYYWKYYCAKCMTSFLLKVSWPKLDIVFCPHCGQRRAKPTSMRTWSAEKN